MGRSVNNPLAKVLGDTQGSSPCPFYPTGQEYTGPPGANKSSLPPLSFCSLFLCLAARFLTLEPKRDRLPVFFLAVVRPCSSFSYFF